MNLLQDKVVVVTGSSRGIGRATALDCARHGAHLVLHYLGDQATQDEVESLGKEITGLGSGRKSIAVPGDISDEATAQKIVDLAVLEFGRIDVLVSNAGICPFHSFLDMPLDVYRRTRAVNMDGAFYIVQGE